MKRFFKFKTVIKNTVIIVLISSALFTAFYSANIGYHFYISEYSHKKTGYYSVQFYPSEYIDNIEELGKKNSQIFDSDEYQKFINDPENVSIFLNAMNSTEDFYTEYIGRGSESIFISPEEMKKYPDIEQTILKEHPHGKEIYDRIYSEYKNENFNSGQYQGFEWIGRANLTPQGECLKLDDGYMPEYSYSYSEYFDTDKPMPVVIGCELADLFELGKTYDAFIYMGLTEEEKEIYSDKYPDGTHKILIAGVLSKDSYYLFGDKLYLDKAVIIPCADVFSADYSAMTSERDKILYEEICNNLSMINVLTPISPVRAHEKYMETIRNIGFDKYIKDTMIKYNYMAKGMSLKAYNGIIIFLLTVLFIMVLAAVVSSVNTSLKKNTRKFAVHFISGALPSQFAAETVLPIILDTYISCAAALLLIRFSRKRLMNTNISYILTASEGAAIVFAAATVICILCVIYSVTKINKTDFSRVLKEGE